SPTRDDAKAAIRTFETKYGAKYPKAVNCLTKDTDALLAFYDFPVEWRGGTSRYLLGKPRWSRLGHWAWYDSISLSLMIREVLSPGPETLVKD
ncbi:hypothetical protein AB6A68_15225, partial [Ferrimicrobium acidiphilum]